jgi:type VI secretion system protein VasG
MSTVNVTRLIEKLNQPAKESLEKALNLCCQQTHYQVELTHWLLALLTNKQALFYKVLIRLSIDVDQLHQTLQQHLEPLRRGNNQTPVLSPMIIDLIHEAWLVTSLQWGECRIHSGALLFALINNCILQQVCGGLSPIFQSLSVAQIQQAIDEILRDSGESVDGRANQASVQIESKQSSSALSQYTINLNEQARAGKIDAAIGREDEIRQVMDILSRRRQNNAILVGEPGVGKTAIVEGLALSIISGEVPDHLKSVVIHALDMGLLQAGAGVKGEFENRLKQLMRDIKHSPHPIILLIDEAHTLIGAGAQAGQNDAANLLKPALARGELRAIAATTWREYKQYVEKDAALTRRFQVVNIKEPDVATATHMLRSLVVGLEKHHGIKIRDSALHAASALSQRYITGRQLPDKAISVLDTACARVASQQTVLPGSIEKEKQQLKYSLLEYAQLKREQASEGGPAKAVSALGKKIAQKKIAIKQAVNRWKKECQLVKTLIKQHQALATRSPEEKSQSAPLNKTAKKTKKQLTHLQGESPLVSPYVDEHAIANVIADWTGIPLGRMMKGELSQLLNIEQSLNQRIIGQSHAIKQVALSLYAAAAKLADPGKPRGVFLLVGPSGVGKTETAIALAEKLYGSRESLQVINLSEFQSPHKVATLSGAPPGYVGYGEGGVLTEAIRRQPYSLLLLDEVEKAHPSVWDFFYQVFDKGCLQDGQGRYIDFKNTLIILTSNACSDLISNSPPDIKNRSALLHQSLEKIFKPAFLGRVTIVPYEPLQPLDLQKIAQLKLAEIQERFKTQQHVALTWDDSLVDYVLSQCQKASIGARQIDHCIQKTILPVLSKEYLSRVLRGGALQEAHVGFDRKVIVVC